MEIKNCRGCGRLFNYIGGGSLLCPVCVDALEEKFKIAKEYIKENKGANVHEVAAAADVSVKQIEKWVREERLIFAADSLVGIECERCGAMIRSGRFCDACKAGMSNQLSSAYRKEAPKVQTKKDLRDKAKMRFLDK